MKKTVAFAVLAIAVVGILGGAYLLKFSGGEVAAEETAGGKTSAGGESATSISSSKEAPSVQKSGADLCISCHGEVKSFHYPAKTSRIDMAKGMNPRTCISCHSQKVHEVHKSKLDSKSILCDTCHKNNGDISKPKAEKGMLLVCELCHARGNYIEIHIEGSILKEAPLDEKWIKSYKLNNDCGVCHFGEYSFIHQGAIGRWREKIENITNLGEVEPLNISYL